MSWKLIPILKIGRMAQCHPDYCGNSEQHNPSTCAGRSSRGMPAPETTTWIPLARSLAPPSKRKSVLCLHCQMNVGLPLSPVTYTFADRMRLTNQVHRCFEKEGETR